MGALGDMATAALFESRDKADEAWGILADAGIGASVITDPGIMGKYEVAVMVDRDELDAAQAALAEFMNS